MARNSRNREEEEREEAERRAAEEAARLAAEEAARAEAEKKAAEEAEKRKAEEDAKEAKDTKNSNVVKLPTVADTNAVAEEAAKQVELATEAPKVGDPSPKGIPKLNRVQHLQIGQKISIDNTKTRLVKAGELDQLPTGLEDERDKWEKRNKAGQLNTNLVRQWSSTGNEVNITLSSIKDITQAAYVASTLKGKSRSEILKDWAEEKGLPKEDVLWQAEKIIGDQLFDAPQSYRGKMKQAGMYTLDGEPLDMDTATDAQYIQAVRLIPEGAPYRKQAEDACRAHLKLPKDYDLGFIDSADLTASDYKAKVKEFDASFAITEGHAQDNVETYLTLLGEIQENYENPRVRRNMEDALAYAYGKHTGQKAPSADEANRMLEQWRKDNPNAVQDVDEDGKPVNWFVQMYRDAKTTVDDVFNAMGWFQPPSETEAEPEEASAGMGGRAHRDGGGGSYTSAPALDATPPEIQDGTEAIVAAQEADAQGKAAAEVQGPAYQPIQEKGQPAEVQGPAYQPQQTGEEPVQSNAEKYVNHVPYNSEMTNEEALLAYVGGAALDPRNAEQIGRLTGNSNAMGLINGVGMYTSVQNEDGKWNSVDRFTHYGEALGMASLSLANGSLPDDIWAGTALGLMDIVTTIDELIADPRNGITVPKGKNPYDYVLSLPKYEHLAQEALALGNVQAQVNEAYSEQIVNEAQAREAQAESYKASMMAGHGTPEMAEWLANYYDGTEILDSVRDDSLRLQYRYKVMNDKKFWDTSSEFWMGNSAPAVERRAIIGVDGLNSKADKDFRKLVTEATVKNIDEYTLAARKMGVSLEQYLGAAGITSAEQLLQISYSELQAKGNAFGSDEEAQGALNGIAAPGTFGGGVVLGGMAGGTGFAYGVTSQAEDRAQAINKWVDESDSNIEKLTKYNEYREAYGDEAETVAYAEYMQALESDKVPQEQKDEIRRQLAEARTVWDVTYEIDPDGLLESGTRWTVETLNSWNQELEAFASKLPPKYRMIFDVTSALGSTAEGMLTVAAVTALTRNPKLASSVAFGAPEYWRDYNENRQKGMSRETANLMAIGSGAIAAATNFGGAGTMNDVMFGNTPYKLLKDVIKGKNGASVTKSIATYALGNGMQEAGEELGEAVSLGAWNLLDKAVVAHENGTPYSLSMITRNALDSIEETDQVAASKELAMDAGFGFVMGLAFGIGGASKTAKQIKKGFAMQKEYESLSIAEQLSDGTLEFTDENVGKMLTAMKEDIQDPVYRKYIDSGNKMAREQNANMAAMLLDTGSIYRREAMKAAARARTHAEKAQAAKDASITASTRFWKLRERVNNGDRFSVAEMESARIQWQKAETALQEADGAAAKAQEDATNSMTQWLTEVQKRGRVICAQELEHQMDKIIKARLDGAAMLMRKQEAEAEKAKEEADAKAAAEAEIDAELDMLSDDELDAEIELLTAQTAEPEASAPEANVTEEVEPDAEVQAEESAVAEEAESIQQVAVDNGLRKDRIIARERSRFDRSFERIIQAIEDGDDVELEAVQAQYDKIGERLRTLGVDTDALVAQQYGLEIADVNAAYAEAQEKEARRTEEEKYEQLSYDLSNRMQKTNDDLESIAPARRYFTTHDIYVNESQASDILAAEGLKSIPQVNRRYAMRLTTDESKGAMPLDGHVLSDISTEASGIVNVNGDPVAEMLGIMHRGKELVAKLREEKAEAKELREKRDAFKASILERAKDVATGTTKEQREAADVKKQAEQINNLVADENSTVEQIDSAVDRIEGVSMSMSAEEDAGKTAETESAPAVESTFKDPEMQKLASDLYKNWGIRLRTADLDARDDGFYDRESNTIVLNKRLTSGEKQRTVVMHELIHFCEGQPWYPQFIKDILAGAYSSEAEIEENRERLRELGYAEKDIDFELVAHAAKPLFEGDEVLIGNLLENGKASAVKRAYAAISQYIARRKAKKMGMGKQYDALLSARKTLAKGLKNAKVTKKQIANAWGEAQHVDPVGNKKTGTTVAGSSGNAGASVVRSGSGNTNIPQSGTGVNSQSMQNGASHSYSGPVLSQYGNQTAQEIDWINQAVKDQLKGSTHEVQTDRAAITETLARIEEMGGVQEALNDLMSRPVDRWNAQDQVMAQVLMAKAEYDGDVTTEAVIAMMYDKSGSEAGLTLQKRKLLAKLNAQNALALAAKLSGRFNLKNGGSSQYAPIGNGKPLEKSDTNSTEANRIIDRAQRVNNAIIAERGMDDVIERRNRWGIPVTRAQMYLIEKYGLKHTDLPGVHYNRATVKQRMLAAILATDTSVVYDVDVQGNRNGLLGLIQQLEAMKAGKAVETVADATYIHNQMAEMKAQSNGSEDPYLDTQEAKTALARAYDAIVNIVPATTWQKASSLAYMNMLSATTTGVKNVLGNTVMAPMEAVSETIAAGVDKAVSAKTKNRTTAVSTKRETVAGLMEGLSEIANTFADTYIRQADTSYGRKYEMSGDAPRVYQNAKMEFKRRMVDFIMQLGDRPFFRAEYARQMEMIQRLCAEGKMKKKDVITTADGRQVVSYVEMTEADMHKEAAQRALERVFQEDNAIVDWVNRAPMAMRPFMQAVIPFVKTPTNIAKRMLDYSPIGLAKTIASVGYHAATKDGGFDQRKFVMGIGRGLTGTGMIMAGALLSSLGILDIGDGYGEEDDSKLYGAGMANYDPYGKYINIGGNKASLDWLGAAGIWMTIGAAAAAEWAGDSDTTFGDKLYTTMLKSGPEILNLLFDNTMLSSVSELLGGAEDGEELGTNVLDTVVGSALQQYLSPANIRQFAKFTDEYERDYRNDNPVIEAINKNVIRYWPVLRQTLPIKYDITGDPVRQSSKYGWGREDENVILNFMNMYMSPTNIQSDKGDRALEEVIDLAYRQGDTGCIPGNLITTSGKITIPSAMAKRTSLDTGAGENKLELSVDEQRKYNQMYASLCFNGTEKGRKYKKIGTGTYDDVQGIRDIIDSRAYSRATDAERVEMIEAAMKKAKEIVQAQICIDRGYAK